MLLLFELLAHSWYLRLRLPAEALAQARTPARKAVRGFLRAASFSPERGLGRGRSEAGSSDQYKLPCVSI